MLTKSFNKISKNDTQIAGGKGASLGEMIQNEILVPDGFVVLSDAFERFLEETDLNVEIDSILHTIDIDVIHTVEEASEKIQSLVLNSKIPEDIAKEIKKEFKKLNSKFVAVRSSATAEDGLSEAWAGQLDSFLNTTEEYLLENVKKCWASLFTPRAIFYRFEKKLHKEKISVAVVIQKMIESEMSGIAFSVHPITQDKNQIIIEAGFGLGEAIVSGSITPDSYVVEKEPRRIIDVNVNIQNKKLVRGKDWENDWIDLSEDEGGKQVLTEEQIQELTELILKIENHYKTPQDIEWAIEDNKIYIVQSRPVTTLGEIENKIEKNDILDFVKNNKFYRQITYPFIPVIYFESTMRSYIENPLQEKLGIEKFPNVIEILRDKFEGWDDQNIQKITNEEKIEFIIKESRNIIDKYNEPIKNLLEKDYLKIKNDNFIESIKSLDQICMEVYQRYIFFIHEFFETDNKDLLTLLPEIRIELSEFVDNIYQCCDIFIKNLDKKFTNVSEKLLGYSSFEDLIFLLENPDKTEDFEKRINKEAIIFIYDNDKLHTIKNQKDIKNIIEVLEKQKEKIDIKDEIEGDIVFKGKERGEVVTLLEKDYSNAKEILKGKKDYILVTPMTRPEIVQYMKNVSAIITDEGGITCHAAIVSRELKKPCITGTKIATQVLKDGDLVEVDADNGVVRILERNKDKYDLHTTANGFNILTLDMIFNNNDTYGAVDYITLRGEDDVMYAYLSPKGLKESYNLSKDLLNDDFFEEFTKESEEMRSDLKKYKAKKLNGNDAVSEWEKVKELNHKFCKLYRYYEQPFQQALEEEILKSVSRDKFAEILTTKNFDEIKDFDVRRYAKRLISMGELKLKIHEDSVEFFLDPYFEEYVSEKINLPREIVSAMRYPEFEEAMKGKLVVTEEELKNRLKGTVFVKENKRWNLYSGEKYLYWKDKINRTQSEEIKGDVAFPGVVTGKAVIHLSWIDITEAEEGDILVAGMTNPQMIPMLKKVSAIITDEGGITCHAAIISRELKKPCIVGTKNGTRMIKNGDLIEVDANEGVVRILEKNKN